MKFCIVFSHGNLKTMMVDASNICEKGRRQNYLTDENIDLILDACVNEVDGISRLVSPEEIIDQQYNLNPSIYLAALDNTIDNGVEFGTVVSITRGAQLQAKELDEMASETASDTQYLMLANIQDGIIDDELPYIKELDEKLQKYCLKNNDLVISKIGTPYKTAVAEVKPGKKIEFFLDYNGLQTYNFSKLAYNPNYRLIMIGASPHSTTGTGHSSSVIAELEGHPDKYPRVVRITNEQGELKVTKSGFKKALEKLISEDYLIA